MQRVSIAAFMLALSCGLALPACKLHSNQAASSSVRNASAGTPAPANVLAVTVGTNGTTNTICGLFHNQACAAVTVCQHGTKNCQTIDNILLDTGSQGLRIFASVLTLPLTPEVGGTGALAECMSYGGGNSQWGPVVSADVILGGEPAAQTLIQVIDPAYGTPPAACTSAQSVPDVSPGEAGYNGILGIGLLAQDCGPSCATDVNNGLYYSCTEALCAPTTTSNQVQDPITLLPKDNNGFILTLPTVPVAGSPSVTGQLILGIGTGSNNTPAAGLTAVAADQNGCIATAFGAGGGATSPSLIDSGTTDLHVSAVPSLPACTDSYLAYYYCPTSMTSLTATNIGTNGATNSVSYQIASAKTFDFGSNHAFMDIASPDLAGNLAIWGLPFFFGRSIYFGFEGAPSTLGVGPFYAYQAPAAATGPAAVGSSSPGAP